MIAVAFLNISTKFAKSYNVQVLLISKISQPNLRQPALKPSPPPITTFLKTSTFKPKAASVLNSRRVARLKRTVSSSYADVLDSRREVSKEMASVSLDWNSSETARLLILSISLSSSLTSSLQIFSASSHSPLPIRPSALNFLVLLVSPAGDSNRRRVESKDLLSPIEI